MLNPILKNLRNFYFYIIAWVIISVAHAILICFIYQIDLSLSFIDSFIYHFIFAGLALNFWYPVRYLNIDQKKNISLIFHHLILCIFFIVFWITLSYYLSNFLIPYDETYLKFRKSYIQLRAFNGLLYYCIIILIYYLYIFYLSFKEKLIKENELQMLVKETQLSLLKSQLNPHFIFNSLNSVSSLTISAPMLAQEMIIKLSAFLRSALNYDVNQLISFEEELRNSQLYLDIEKTRFGEKLILENSIDEETFTSKIPNMILQPLLENAIKYGLYNSLTPVTISVKSFIENTELKIIISNNYEAGNTGRKGKGIGLKNVKERLYLIYGRNDLAKISEDNNLFTITLSIPQSK